MAKKCYIIDSTWEGNYGEDIHFNGIIEIDDEVMLQVDDEWRTAFYSNINSKQDVAEHIAYNMIVNDATISRLDGFANFEDSCVMLVR